jgi:hypothetical protein
MAQDNMFVHSLLSILQEHKVLKPSEIKALEKGFGERSNINFEEFLIDEGIVDKADMLKALSTYYNVPPIDVVGIFFKNHLLNMFSVEVMKRLGFIPYRHEGDILQVIAYNPQHPELLSIIGQYVSYEVTFMVSIYGDIFDAIEEFSVHSPTEMDDDGYYDEEEE